MDSIINNESDRHLLLLVSDRKIRQKELYSYMPKLSSVLNRNSYTELKDYVKNSLQPELKYIGELKPGEYSYYPLNTYVYVVSYINNQTPKLAIDISKLYNENKYNIVTENNKIKNRISEFRGKSISEISGAETDTKEYNWILTRQFYNYVYITSDRVFEVTSNYCPSYILFIGLILILIIIIIVNIIFYSLKINGVSST